MEPAMEPVDVITYSFLCGKDQSTVTPYVNLIHSAFVTRRIGSLPLEPALMVANCGKHGNWVTQIAYADGKEHPVFDGYSKPQVTHSWLKQDGTLMIGTSVAKALELILKRCYPTMITRSMTWQALDDVIGMIGDVNSPTTLLGKIPSLSTSDGQVELYHAHLRSIKESLKNMVYK